MGKKKDGGEKRPPPSLEQVIYTVAEVVSVFDWISPLIGMAETIINDPTPLQSNSWTFFVKYRQSLLGRGLNAKDIEKLLNERGIKTWGSGFGEDEYFFSVSVDQAQYAEYILLESRVPINEKFIGAPPPRRK